MREREETWKEFSSDTENAAALLISAFDLEDVELFEVVLLRRRRGKVSSHSERSGQKLVKMEKRGRFRVNKLVYG